MERHEKVNRNNREQTFLLRHRQAILIYPIDVVPEKTGPVQALSRGE